MLNDVGHARLRFVPIMQRVTLYWLEMSVKDAELRPCVRGAPAFRPLPYQLPLKSFSNLRCDSVLCGILTIRFTLESHCCSCAVTFLA